MICLIKFVVFPKKNNLCFNYFVLSVMDSYVCCLGDLIKLLENIQFPLTTFKCFCFLFESTCKFNCTLIYDEIIIKS